MDSKQRAEKIREIAKKIGFEQVRFAKAEFLSEEARQLEQWLKKDFHGKMDYMEGHFDLRTDPSKLVPDAKSVICLTLNYYPENISHNNEDLKISKYAWGKDYHKVIKKKLKELLHEINAEIGEINGRGFVDSAPVLEKAWAQRSGIGWMGKHSNVISKQKGSFFFLAELIVDMELEADGPVTDHCGTCTACIDACPTDAIVDAQVVDASKCISYLTIELKDAIPEEFKGKMEGWAFGCDVCQDVCPWNRFSKPTQVQDFTQRDELTKRDESDWLEMTEEIFDQVVTNSPIRRTGLEGIKRNIQFLRTNDQ